MDCEEVHALCGLCGDGSEDVPPREVLDATADDHGVDGHRADGYGGLADEEAAGLVQVALLPSSKVFWRFGPFGQSSAQTTRSVR